jgi:sugar phosphate isomerase/epimerase
LKPAIFTSFDHALPIAEVLPLIRQAGFQAVSFGAWAQGSDSTTPRGRSVLQKLLANNNLTIDSIHAPFPQGDQLFSVDEVARVESVRQCQMALDAAVELDGRIVVIHLIQPYGIPAGEVRRKMIEQGRRSVGVLAAHAGDRGVKLALENGQEREYDQVLESLLGEFDDPHVGLCYDSGHENVQGTCFRLLEEFGHRLLTVHIHDNKGSDTHELPYEGTIDWEQFRRVIHGLDYSGNLLLEVNMDQSQSKDHRAFLAQAMVCAQRLLLRLPEDHT